MDEVAILALDYAIANVIRTTVTDFVLRPVGTARNCSSVFTAGHDYVIRPAAANLSGSGAFRSAANRSELEPTLLSALQASHGGKLHPGDKLLLDYDLQPGTMGFHTYDLWAGLVGHFPYPPASPQAAPPGLPARPPLARRRQRLGGSAGLGAGLGSPHTDLGSGFQSGDLFDPLYFEVSRG